MVSGTVCPLSTVSVFDAEVPPTAIVPHTTGFGEKLRTLSVLPPCPCRYSCALLPALSFTLTEPVMTPLATGLAVTSKVQLAPGPNDAGQLFVWAKCPDTVIEARLMLPAV